MSNKSPAGETKPAPIHIYIGLHLPYFQCDNKPGPKLTLKPSPSRKRAAIDRVILSMIAWMNLRRRGAVVLDLKTTMSSNLCVLHVVEHHGLLAQKKL